MSFWIRRLASIALAVGGCFLIDWFAKENLKDFIVRLVVLAALYITLAVSLNLINGITGQFSIGHAAFYQVGAYAAGLATVTFYKSQPLGLALWIPLMMLVGGVTASVAGLVVGLPSLRLRGDYLAIVTLGFGEIIRIVTQNLKVVGAASGMAVEPKMSTPMIWLAWLLAITSIAVCRNLLQTAHGLGFLAVREDEIASSAMGVNVTRTKVAAFVLGSAFAGMAGGFLAHYEGFLIPTMFTMDVSFIILTMVVLGGSGSVTGSVIAAILLSTLPEFLRDIQQISMAGLVAAAISIIAGVVAVRYVSQHVHTPSTRRIAYPGAIIGSIILTVVLSKVLAFIPTLANASTDGSRIRLVIFAVTLVVLMLVRPQGLLGHREFGWGSLRRSEA
ncbi:MAG: branched-chain amino acid ABC transporter permease [Armatimonadetes bacterium]|nr:branched-chain amino acid ABC transporter permease [Armatimonadota bacterium]